MSAPTRPSPIAAIGCVLVSVCWASASATWQGTDALLARVGERVAEYYRRAQRVICIERATVQPIGSNWTPVGFSRTVESELRIEAPAADGGSVPEATVVRKVLRINGRAPRERDRTDRSGCTDPEPVSRDALAFLLPGQQREYQFTSVRDGTERDRPALVVDFRSAIRRSRLVLIEDERGHDDCFDWTGPVATSGRIWIDAATYDVLRVERRVDGLVDVRVPWALQLKHALRPWVVIERSTETVRYEAVAFQDPDEVLLLPDSIESLIVLRGGLQSTRRTWTFGQYRRFLTGGRVVQEP